MTKQNKPVILEVKEVAHSRLFTIQQVQLAFSNGQQRVYERMKPSGREAVMILALQDDQVMLIEEYAVGLEDYELGFPKGLIDTGETAAEAGLRELREEIGYGAHQFHLLGRVTMAPSYFSSVMNIFVAEQLYAAPLAGDEPELLPLIRWPVNKLLDLLQQPQFQEARNLSALFLLREWLVKQGRLSY
jgi:ADP-ribose diphosphatase